MKKIGKIAISKTFEELLGKEKIFFLYLFIPQRSRLAIHPRPLSMIITIERNIRISYIKLSIHVQ